MGGRKTNDERRADVRTGGPRHGRTVERKDRVSDMSSRLVANEQLVVHFDPKGDREKNRGKAIWSDRQFDISRSGDVFDQTVATAPSLAPDCLRKRKISGSLQPPLPPPLPLFAAG